MCQANVTGLSCAIDGPDQLLMPPSLKRRVKGETRHVTWLFKGDISSFQQWDPGGEIPRLQQLWYKENYMKE
jgi:hypothetical protein